MSIYHYGKAVGAAIHHKSNGLRNQQFIKELLDTYQSARTPAIAPDTLVSGKDFGQYLKYHQHQHYEEDKGTLFLQGVNEGAKGEEFHIITDNVTADGSDDEDHVGSDIEDDAPLDDKGKGRDNGDTKILETSVAPREDRYYKSHTYLSLARAMSKRSAVKQRIFKVEGAALDRHARRAVTGGTSTGPVGYYRALRTFINHALESVHKRTNTTLLHYCYDFATKIMRHTSAELETLWDPAAVKMRKHSNEYRFIRNTALNGNCRELTLNSLVNTSSSHLIAIRAMALVFPFTTLSIEADTYSHAFRDIVAYLCIVVPTLRTIRIIISPYDDKLAHDPAEALRKQHSDIHNFTAHLRYAVNASAGVDHLAIKYVQDGIYPFMNEDHPFISENLFIPIFQEETKPAYPFIAALKVKYMHNENQWTPFYRNLFKNTSEWGLHTLRANCIIDELNASGVLDDLQHLRNLRGELNVIGESFTKWFTSSKLVFARFTAVDSENATVIFEIEPRSTSLTWLISHPPPTLRVLEIVVDLDVTSKVVEQPYLTNESLIERLSCVRKDAQTTEIYPELAAARLEQERRVVSVAPSLLTTLVNAITETPMILSSRRLFPGLMASSTSSSSSSSTSSSSSRLPLFGDLLGEKFDHPRSRARPHTGPWRDWPPYD